MRRALLVVLMSASCAKQAPASAPADSATPQHEEPAAPALGAVTEDDEDDAPVLHSRERELPRAAPVTGDRDGDGDGDLDLDLGGDLAALEAELGSLEAELRDHGVRLRGYKKNDTSALRRRDDTAKSASSTVSRCQRVCDLAAAVCGIRTRICAMAQTHRDEPKYGAACRRAERDCTRATDACDDCDA